jgi:hypothetical protein
MQRSIFRPNKIPLVVVLHKSIENVVLISNALQTQVLNAGNKGRRILYSVELIWSRGKLKSKKVTQLPRHIVSKSYVIIIL